MQGWCRARVAMHMDRLWVYNAENFFVDSTHLVAPYIQKRRLKAKKIVLRNTLLHMIDYKQWISHLQTMLQLHNNPVELGAWRWTGHRTQNTGHTGRISNCETNSEVTPPPVNNNKGWSQLIMQMNRMSHNIRTKPPSLNNSELTPPVNNANGCHTLLGWSSLSLSNNLDHNENVNHSNQCTAVIKQIVGIP